MNSAQKHNFHTSSSLKEQVFREQVRDNPEFSRIHGREFPISRLLCRKREVSPGIPFISRMPALTFLSSLQQRKEESLQLFITNNMKRLDLVGRSAVHDLHVSIQCVGLGLYETSLQRKHYLTIHLCTVGIVRLAQDPVQVVGIGLPSVGPDSSSTCCLVKLRSETSSAMKGLSGERATTFAHCSQIYGILSKKLIFMGLAP